MSRFGEETGAPAATITFCIPSVSTALDFSAGAILWLPKESSIPIAETAGKTPNGDVTKLGPVTDFRLSLSAALASNGDELRLSQALTHQIDVTATIGADRTLYRFARHVPKS